MSAEKVGEYFYEDCRVFLSKFKVKNCLGFDAFAEVWQEMKFSYVLSQWRYLGEMQEIIEEFLKVCKTIWLKAETVEERVCGLYLLRAIYLKQPAARHVKISLSHEDWQWMKHFLYLIKDFVQNETRYVLQELFEMNAFTISVPDCTRAEGKDDGGILQSVVAEFTQAQSEYRAMFSELERDNFEYNAQRKMCLRVYPQLRSYANAETDRLVAQLTKKLSLFEEEVGKIREDLFEENVTPVSSMYGDETVSEETEERRSKKRKTKLSPGLKAMDCFGPEESSDSEEDITILDMPQLHSEDSDTGTEDEESCDDPSDHLENSADVHMSDFEVSSASSQDDERLSKRLAATGGEGCSSDVVPESRRTGGSGPRVRGQGRGRVRVRGRGRGQTAQRGRRGNVHSTR